MPLWASRGKERKQLPEPRDKRQRQRETYGEGCWQELGRQYRDAADPQ